MFGDHGQTTPARADRLAALEYIDASVLSATLTHMESVGIREMRQNLSRYAQRARGGESFVITDRGNEVARLVPAAPPTTAIDRLVVERGARRGHGDLLDLLEELPEPIPGPQTEEIIEELRRDRL